MVLRQEVKDGDPWYSRHRFRVSPINYSEEVQGSYSFPTEMLIQDGTLRKMEATPGARQYSIEEKLEIARLLDGVGVKELGTHPSLFEDTVKGESVIEGVQALCKAGLKMKIRASIHDLGWVKGDYSYLDMLADTGLDGIEINPGIPEFLRTAGTPGAEEVEKTVARTLEYARRKGLDPGLVFGDIGRRDLDPLLELMNLWLDHGVGRFMLSDHYSELNPDSARYVVRYIRNGLKAPAPILVHAHNAFGMATANALAVASAGAWVETTVNGFGDRGFASFEEVVLALEMLYGVKTGIRLEGITELSQVVERITGFENHPFKPVVGETTFAPANAFQYRQLLDGAESGSIHIVTFEPGVVGSRAPIVWTVNALSPEAVRAKLDHMELPYGDEDIQAIIEALHGRLKMVDKAPFWFSDSEASEICRSTLARGKG